MSIHPAALPYLYIYFIVFPSTPTEAVLFHGFPKTCPYPLKERSAMCLPMPKVPAKLQVTPSERLPQDCPWRCHPLRSLLCTPLGSPGVPAALAGLWLGMLLCLQAPGHGCGQWAPAWVGTIDSGKCKAGPWGLHWWFTQQPQTGVWTNLLWNPMRCCSSWETAA